MTVVRGRQGGFGFDVEIKRDKSLLTTTDKASEKIAMEILLNNLPQDLGIHAEERGKIRMGNKRILFDPIDGTKPFIVGATTSTVIAALYDEILNKITICVVGDPATGRIWSAETEKGVTLREHDFSDDNGEYTNAISSFCRVTPPATLGETGRTVFCDFYPDFKRKGRTVLSNFEIAMLFEGLFGIYGVTMLGSNGAHHALVANGAQGIAGAITTAIGGPWDVAPALLVTEAGGFARAFTVLPDGELADRDPLDPESFDILITAVTETDLTAMVSILFKAKSACEGEK